MHLQLASDKEFAELPWRFEGFGHLHLPGEALFQVENVLQASIAAIPCLV